MWRTRPAAYFACPVYPCWQLWYRDEKYSYAFMTGCVTLHDPVQ